MPTVSEIREHFLSNAPWVDREKTVDTIKVGDPEKQVNKVAVGWMATIYDLCRAIEQGCDLFITHEPTFWEHSPAEGKNRKGPGGKEKATLIEESGITILRCHDVWDRWPKIGIRGAWAKGLQLDRLVAESDDGICGIYEIEETTLRQFANHILSRIRTIGHDCVQVLGDPDKKISRPALGVGCIMRGVEMIGKGADCIVCCFDGDSYWRNRERYDELDAAVITVEHGASEHWGMESLADYVRTTWKELEVIYLDLYPRPWMVT